MLQKIPILLLTLLSGLISVAAQRSSAFLDLDGLDQRTGLSLYGRVGIGTIENDAVQTIEFERDNDVQLIGGVGLEYGTNMGLGIRAEYTNYDSDANYVGLSLLYRFGGGIGPGELPELDELQIPTELPSAPVPQPVPQPAPPQPNIPTAPPPVITAPPPVPTTGDLLQDIEVDSSCNRRC